MEKKIHQGKNIARFRQMLGMKQDKLASIMGDDWTQIRISRLEAKEEIEPAILDEVARALKIPAEAIENFNEEAAIVNIQNNYDSVTAGSGPIANDLNYHQCTFNPLEKLIEAMEEIKRLSAALIKEKDEKFALLEKMLGEKK